MKNIIPGHVAAFTWMLALVVTGTVLWAGGDWVKVIGGLLLVKGAYLGDQATHLNQEAHSDPAPTWIEQMQQRHRILFVLIGLILAGVGAFLMVN